MRLFFKLKRKLNIFITILLFHIKLFNSEQIIFNFQTTNTKVDSSYDFMSKLFSNEIYTNLKINSSNTNENKKTIPLIINSEQVAFSLSPHFYNISNFNESTLPIPRSFVWEEIDKAIQLNDNIFVNSSSLIKGGTSNTVKEMNFTAKFLYALNHNSNYLGLNFTDLNEHNVVSIFKTLMDNKLIDNYQWCPKINKRNKYNWLNIDGELVIGGNCHDYLPNIFEQNKISEFEMISHGQYVEYSMKVDDFYIGDNPDKNSLYPKQLFFGVNYLTIGSVGYENTIANLFFNIGVPKNICFVEAMNKYPNIHYYYCNTSLDKDKKFDIKSFPDLCMDISNSTFCFNYNDLFIEDPNDKNILYFIIVFMNYDPTSDYTKFFHFGLQFYSKYQLSFDPKNKRIYYFGTKEQSNQKNKNDNNSQNNWYRVVLIIIIIVVAGIILLALGMLLQKKLTKLPRKVRANELDDNFLYENQGNINT